MESSASPDVPARDPVLRLFVCGDLMTGRGVDQILPNASEPRLFEPLVSSALEYVALAEKASGPIPRSVAFEYIWGDALAELKRMGPDARIVNLETAVTVSQDAWADKQINYRMHPANVPCLTTAGIDCCVLANNHVLDWGRAGLEETLAVLHRAGIRTAGAGNDDTEAAAPAVIMTPAGKRILVYGIAAESSGVPRNWRATAKRSGVNWIEILSSAAVDRIARRVARDRRPGDIVVTSIHWGGNWGYEVSRSEREFARGLIDTAGVDLVHGHSSHHPKGIEVHRHKAILYGCGDLLNDYEGIGGYTAFRGDLGLMYFPALDAGTGDLRELTMIATRTRHFRINKASAEDLRWLADRMDAECIPFGSRVRQMPGGDLILEWARS